MVAALEQRIQALEAQVAALLAAQPRDTADAALRQQLAASTRALPFASLDLLRHADVDPDLHTALEAADLTTAGELGAWLRDQAGIRDGVAVVRLRRRRWQVTYTSGT